MHGLQNLLFFVLISFAAHVHAWTLAKDKQGIQVFTQDSQYSGFKMFRGEVLLDSNLENALEFLKDVAKATIWLHDCKESKLLESITENHYRVYQVIKAPWPVHDRDYVLDIQVKRSPQEGKAIIEVTGLNRPDLAATTSKRVRVTELHGIWTLIEQSEDSVKIVYETEANPTGKIPAWLANAFVVDQPYNTLLNLKNHFARQQ